MRKALVALFITVLISQPVFALGGATAVVDRNEIPTVPAADPERGCQYSGADLTNHVPVFINGTSDFESQDWPGAGSPESPYMMERLNITYDVGLAGIRIIETDAYFVIRDCFVKQVSALPCIELYNTSHAAIEYTTAISPTAAITCQYTNNLEVSWSIATGGTNMALTIDYASDTVLQWNLLSSTTRRGLLAEYCNDLRSEHNEYVTPATDYSCAFLTYCDRASSQYDHSYGGNGGFYAANSEEVTIVGFEGEDNQIGIGAENSPWAAISDCIITKAAEYGVYLLGSPNATIDQCILTQCSWEEEECSLYISNSGDTQVTNIQVVGSGGRGIFVSNSDEVALGHNVIQKVPTDAIYVQSSDRVTIDHNQVYGAAEEGIYLQSCINLTVTNNEITDSGLIGMCLISCIRSDVQGNSVADSEDVGIYSTASDYISVDDNIVSEAEAQGIYVSVGIEAHVGGNTVGMCETGIWLQSNENATVIYNTVNSSVTGMYFEDLTGATLTDNTISECRTGVQLENADSCTVEDNTIEECWETGIYLHYADNALVRGNDIVGPEERAGGSTGLTVRAILVTYCRNLVFEGNGMWDCGVMYTINGAAYHYNHTYDGNLVNGRPLYHGFNVSETELDGSAWGQVILVASQNVTVSGGTFRRCTIAVQSFLSESSHILGVTSDENYIGFFLWSTLNPIVSGVTVTENYYGVYASDCDFLTVNNTHMFRGIFRGVFLTGSTGMTIHGLNIEYAQQGVYGELAHYSSVTESTFKHIWQIGVGVNSQCSYWNVTDCDFFNCTTGFRADGEYVRVADSAFDHCDYAVYAYGNIGRYGVVETSQFYSNGEAIHVYLGDQWQVINCTALWSASYGIWLSGSTGPEIFGNTIALSGTANGWSDSAGDWDDGVSRGNSWDDYEGTPTYPIGGPSSAVDNYPSLFQPTEPIIDSPLDTSYAEFSTGNYLTWRPYDDFLSHWTVTIDGASWAADAWDFDSISVSIDGLSYGTHSVVVTVWDVDMNSRTDEVKVSVYDDIAPTISHLPNTEVFSTGSGQTLTWAVSDLHPASYEILRNTAEISSGTWTTGSITTSLDGLDPGVYDYTIYIHDLDGNSAYDGVTVVAVLDDTIPTIDSPADDIIIVGTVGNSITWTPEDDHPKRYEVAMEGVVVESGAWSGSKIAFSIDGLEVANYNFTLTVYDGAGHSASDSVLVNVYPYTGYAPTAFDIVPWLIAGGVVGVVAVVGVLYYRKRGR